MGHTSHKLFLAASLTVTVSIATGCGSSADEPEVTDSTELAIGLTGEQLFETATFGGNGRTCGTCHSEATGTTSAKNAKALFAECPNAPLFRSIDSDDGEGDSYTRLLSNATIRVVIPLPPTVRLASDPTATSVVINRGIPTTFNTPALDPVLMSDGREPNLKHQAKGAINAHFEPDFQPTLTQLQKIADYEKTLFSSTALKKFAAGTGPDPGLPPGVSLSEKRGRKFFLPDGACGSCHSGPMLNTAPEDGRRFDFVFAGFPEVLGGDPLPNPPNPVEFWQIQCPEGGSVVCDEIAPDAGFPIEDGWVTVPAPDPGRVLITGNVDDLWQFKITSLRGIKNTAPYFHDNSAATLQELVEHYALVLGNFTGVVFSDQDKKDMVAYMKLL